MNRKEVGNRLRVVRKNLGWTQAVLAEKVDISVSFLGHLERGTRVASVDTWVALCDQLNLSIDNLFGRRTSQSLSDPYTNFSILQHAVSARESINQLCVLLEKPSAP